MVLMQPPLLAATLLTLGLLAGREYHCHPHAVIAYKLPQLVTGCRCWSLSLVEVVAHPPSGSVWK
ncbi:hypothetical protein LJC27_07705 [Christensenellaceae bacterium OttesenSCG-928-M15]|nr:hypothetical protein [Christensenellaceae bacterium OttesenSCG-928-M15]